MAYNKKKPYSRKRKDYASEIKSFAYKMGQVYRGLDNPDSQVAASYNNGLKKVEKKKKPLF